MANFNCITRASFLVSFLPRSRISSSFRTKPPQSSYSYSYSYSYSTTKTPFPLQYDMIIPRPSQPPPPLHHPPPRRRPPPASTQTPDPQLGFDDWVDMKLTSQNQDQSQSQPIMLMDKSKRKYYNKRQKRMYGSDSEDDNNGKHKNNEYVELNQEVVKLRTLHKREEELYFYDAFAYPWEKDKHYKMVYQLEKKFFPHHSFDKAFLEPGQSNAKKKKKEEEVGDESVGEKKEDERLVFFEEGKDVKMDVTEKKVEEFFKCLKKVPGDVDDLAPFVSRRSSGLPMKWDGPTGAVLLVNKPKGFIVFY